MIRFSNKVFWSCCFVVFFSPSIFAESSLNDCTLKFSQSVVGSWRWTNHWSTGTGQHGDGSFNDGSGTAKVLETESGIFEMQAEGDDGQSFSNTWQGRAVSKTTTKNSLGENTSVVYTKDCHLRDDGSLIVIYSNVTASQINGSIRENEVHDFLTGNRWHRTWRSRPAGSDIPFSTWASWTGTRGTD